MNAVGTISENTVTLEALIEQFRDTRQAYSNYPNMHHDREKIELAAYAVVEFLIACGKHTSVKMFKLAQDAIVYSVSKQEGRFWFMARDSKNTGVDLLKVYHYLYTANQMLVYPKRVPLWNAQNFSRLIAQRELSKEAFDSLMAEYDKRPSLLQMFNARVYNYITDSEGYRTQG